MKEIHYTTDTVGVPKAELGDKVHLQTLKDVEVVKCIESGKLMLNIDADQIKPGDFSFIKRIGLTISNPETEKPVALGVEYKTLGRRLADFLEDDSDDYDDSSFFAPLAGAALGGFLGSRSSGGGFSMPSLPSFGGGHFGGGGVSRGF